MITTQTMNPPPAPTGHHRDRYGFHSMVIGEPRQGREAAEARAATVYSSQNKRGIKLCRRKQVDGTYTIWRTA